MDVTSCDVARRLSLFSGSPFLGETPPLGEKPNNSLCYDKGKTRHFRQKYKARF